MPGADCNPVDSRGKGILSQAFISSQDSLPEEKVIQVPKAREQELLTGGPRDLQSLSFPGEQQRSAPQRAQQSPALIHRGGGGVSSCLWDLPLSSVSQVFIF